VWAALTPENKTQAEQAHQAGVRESKPWMSVSITPMDEKWGPVANNSALATLTLRVHKGRHTSHDREHEPYTTGTRH